MAQRAQPALEVPLEEGGDEAAALAAVPVGARVGDAQSPVSSAPSSSNVSGAGAAAPGGRHARQTTPPGCTTNARCGPGVAAARAVGEARRPARDGERAQQVGVEHEPGGVLALGQRPQAADEQQVLLQRRLVLLGEPVARSRASRVAPCRACSPRRSRRRRAQRLGLRDDVEVAALVAAGRRRP